jgi:hypothetical protein
MLYRKNIFILIIILFIKINLSNENTIYHNYDKEYLHFLHCMDFDYDRIKTELFDVWFTLDLFFSMSIEYDYCQIIYDQIHEKMSNVLNSLQLLSLLKTAHKEIVSRQEVEKLLYQVVCMQQHQIIKYIDVLYDDFASCAFLLKLLLQ